MTYFRYVEFRFRPMPVWPHATTPDWERRGPRTFNATWQATMNLLRAELMKLDAMDVVIGAGLAEKDIRRDGLPKDNASWAAHPGIEVSFAAKGRRMVYATDVCSFWQHNVRSIALGLGSLRAVDRYGITRRGEQYAGFAALAAGGPDASRGARLVEEAGGVIEALRKHHPDAGGNERDFIDVQTYRENVG